MTRFAYVGPKDKTTEPLPQPRLEAKLPRRRKREKVPGSGRDFPKGQNSHSGEPFQRGPDLIPRGNGTLLLRIVYHDFRKRIYDSLGKLVDKPEGALAFMDRYIDRTEGRPGRKGQPLTPHVSKFVRTTKDGQEVEMLPSRSAEQAKAAAAATPITGDDAMILGLKRASALVPL